MSQFLLKAENISVSYDSKPIIENCNFEVKLGEFWGVIGPNGSGKTTFLKALCGLLPVNKGQVYIGNKLISSMRNKEIAQHIAYMQQSESLDFSYSAWDIVLAASYPYLKWWQQPSVQEEARAKSAMQYAGVWELRDRLITEVSGGERQRIFYAKALAQNTSLLCLDEPTSALDPGYADEIFYYNKQLCRGQKQEKAVVAVVHDLELAAKFCTHLVLFGQGKILAQGSVSEILTEDLLHQAFGFFAKVYKDPYFEQLRIYILSQQGHGKER